MIWALLFFITDQFFSCLFERQFFYFLIIYFIIQILNTKNTKIKLFFSVFLLLIQDVFVNSRFGICLIYLVPIAILANYLKKLLDPESIKIFYFIFFIIFILMDNFFIRYFILDQNFSLNSTLLKFFINIILEILILLGMLGNRTLFFAYKK